MPGGGGTFISQLGVAALLENAELTELYEPLLAPGGGGASSFGGGGGASEVCSAAPGTPACCC